MHPLSIVNLRANNIYKYRKYGVIIYVKYITNQGAENEMRLNLFSKIKSASFTTLIIGGFFFLLSMVDSSSIDLGGLMFIVIVLFYAGIGNYIYGIPVSILSDYLSNKLSKYRFIVAAFIHLFFGAITSLIIGELVIFALASSLIFFLLEEWENRKLRVIHKKKIVINSILLFTFLFIGGWATIQFLDFSEEKTNNIYLIPEGYEGSIITFYNVSNQSRLKKQEGFNIIPVQVISLEALKNTEIYLYGVTFTSTEDMSYGTVNDKLYYVDSKGKKTPIKDSCVYYGSSGGFTGGGEKEVIYNSLQVTNSECGEKFMLDGNKNYSFQKDEVLNYWMNKLE